MDDTCHQGAAVIAGIEAGDTEVLSGETSRQVKLGFADSMYLKACGS